MMKFINKIKHSTKVKIFLNKVFKSLHYLNDLIFYLLLNFKFYFSSNHKKNVKKFKLITAADTSHFKSVCQLIDTLTTHCVNDEIILYDLGFSNSETDYIKKNYSNIEIKKFNFSNYPKHVHLEEQDAGAYAWKPIIIHNELMKNDYPLIWMDGGNLVQKDLKLIKNYILTRKFYSPYSSDNIKKWTHPTTLSTLDVPKKFLKKRNLNAALIGLDVDQKINNVIENWYKLSLKKQIIIPDGSNKSNHRWDQSLLTILFYQELDYFFKIKTYKLWGVNIHQDID